MFCLVYWERGGKGEIGRIFTSDGIDIARALQEKAIILFILNPLTYPELSPAFGRLVLIDSKKATVATC